MGAFADGIVLHQIAQWHNMGSAVLPPHTIDAMSRNMTWDGLFHAGAWLIVLIGILMFWKAARVGALPESPVVLSGEMVFGWGAFNLIEGVINHHLLALHHVRDIPIHVPIYDWMFLGIGGLGFLLLGYLLMQPVHRRIPT
jgi:uncharacterized membrane protein